MVFLKPFRNTCQYHLMHYLVMVLIKHFMQPPTVAVQQPKPFNSLMAYSRFTGDDVEQNVRHRLGSISTALG